MMPKRTALRLAPIPVFVQFGTALDLESGFGIGRLMCSGRPVLAPADRRPP